MAVFKFVLGHKGKSYQIEKDQKDAPVLGKKIGDTIQGDFLGLAGYEFQISGGSDKDGFPMRKDIEGVMRRKILIGEGTGFHTDVEGLHRRRTLRGNTIAADITQVNCRVVKEGQKPIEEIFVKNEPKEEVKEEAKEVKKDEKKE